MKTSARFPGLAMVVLALFGGAFLLRFLWRGLANGYVPGSLHSTHHAWSASYTVSLFGCVVGIGFSLVLVLMGLRHAGLLGHGGGDAR